MDIKNTLPWLLIALASTANAECYMRSTTVAKSAQAIERIADLKKEVLPVGDKNLCRITFRAYVKGHWYLATGEEIAQSWGGLDTACTRAHQAAKINLLERTVGSSVNAQQDILCTDEPLPITKPSVKIGDIVRESSVQPHPTYFDNFKYRGSLCRWFVESNPVAGGVNLKQGIICRLSDELNWKVVDKW